MATVIDSLIVTLGLNTKGFQVGAERAKKAQGELVRETEASNKKMASGFAVVSKEVLLLASALFAATGAAKFFAGTISDAASLGYLSENLGISTERIQAFQRASERMGGSAGGMTAQLKESVDTLAQLNSGLGPNDALQWFFRLGGSSADLKDGNSLLMARSKIIHDIFQTDPGKAALMAKQMGIMDDQFDLWKQGPEAVKALTDAQEKNSAVTAQNAKEAQELMRKWLDFTDAIKGTFMKAVLALAPAITIILDKFVEWANLLAANKDQIQQLGKNLTDFLTKTDWSGIISDAKEFAASVKTIADSIKDVINRWDEWQGKPKEKLKLKDIPVLGDAISAIDKGAANTKRTFAPLAESDHPVIDMFFGGELNKAMREIFDRRRPGDPPKALPKPQSMQNQQEPQYRDIKTLMDKASYAVNKLVGMGWTKQQASGMVGSLMQESHLDESEVNPKSGAYGIAQWLSKDRIAEFKKWAGQPLVGSSFDKQLEFMNYELTKGARSDAGDAIKTTSTSDQAAVVHRKLYEAPGESEANDVMRKAYARQIDQGIQRANAAAAAAVPAGPAASMAGKVDNSRSSTSTSDTTINGGITIVTQATDMKAAAKEIKPAIEKYNSTMQANTGIR